MLLGPEKLCGCCWRSAIRAAVCAAAAACVSRWYANSDPGGKANGVPGPSRMTVGAKADAGGMIVQEVFALAKRERREVDVGSEREEPGAGIWGTGEKGDGWERSNCQGRSRPHYEAEATTIRTKLRYVLATAPFVPAKTPMTHVIQRTALTHSWSRPVTLSPLPQSLRIVQARSCSRRTCGVIWECGFERLGQTEVERPGTVHDNSAHRHFCICGC